MSTDPLHLARSRHVTGTAAARPTPAAYAAKNKSLGPQAANPFPRALVAAVDPNARKAARKSLDHRQAVDTTSTAPSGKPGRKTAGGLTKDKSFGHKKVAAAGCSVLCTRPYHLSKIALILGPYVYFTAADLGRFAVKRRPSGWRSGPSGSDRQADDGGTPR